MTSHLELLTELQQLDKVPSLERLRPDQKRRTQQLKRWAVYEKEMQNRKRQTDKRRGIVNHGNAAESHKRVSFAANVALLEASARNGVPEFRDRKPNALVQVAVLDAHEQGIIAYACTEVVEVRTHTHTHTHTLNTHTNIAVSLSIRA